jgi:hypothetical protein
MPPGMTDFEKYLICRIDELEKKLSKVDNRLSGIYAVAGAVATVAGYITNILFNK